MRINSFFQASRIIICAALLATAPGCAVVDDVSLRSETMNTSMAEYNQYATLMNIVRASRYEPLNFVAVTQGSPNTSFVGNAAVPNLTFNPYHLATSAITGNSVSSTASNTLTIQSLDDPASWQSMLTPVDVATIGFFIKQGYPQELLFWLFIDRIRMNANNSYHDFANDPDDPTFADFANQLLRLVAAGLTIEVERGAPKSGQNPASQICYNQAIAKWNYLNIVRWLPTAPGGSEPTFHVPRVAGLSGEHCTTEWFSGQVADAQSASSSKNSGAPPGVVVDVFVNGASTKTSTPGSGSTPTPTPTPKPAPTPKATPPDHKVWYDLPRVSPEPGNRPYPAQFTTRSAYAVYQYLGKWARIWLDKGWSQKLLSSDTSDPYLFRITNDQSLSCFSSVVYKAQQYCIPSDADNTKRTFGILHQVTGLNIAHAASLGALTVRTVP
jgi:hypothetical protein